MVNTCRREGAGLKSYDSSPGRDLEAAVTHLGVPPLLTLDADWLRQVGEEPVELLKDDWLDVLLVPLQVF